jgi:hypothetical protein
VLTAAGWVPVDGLRPGGRVCVWDPGSGLLSWEPVARVDVYPAEGPLFVLEAPWLSLLLPADHPVWWRRVDPDPVTGVVSGTPPAVGGFRGLRTALHYPTAGWLPGLSGPPPGAAAVVAALTRSTDPGSGGWPGGSPLLHGPDGVEGFVGAPLEGPADFPRLPPAAAAAVAPTVAAVAADPWTVLSWDPAARRAFVDELGRWSPQRSRPPSPYRGGRAPFDVAAAPVPVDVAAAAAATAGWGAAVDPGGGLLVNPFDALPGGKVHWQYSHRRARPVDPPAGSGTLPDPVDTGSSTLVEVHAGDPPRSVPLLTLRNGKTGVV